MSSDVVEVLFWMLYVYGVFFHNLYAKVDLVTSMETSKKASYKSFVDSIDIAILGLSRPLL